MQCRDAIVVFDICVETARKHGFEDRSVSTLGRHLHHAMMLDAKIVAQRGVSLQHCVGTGTVATGTGRYETLERREFILGAVKPQPGCYVLIAVELGQCVRSAAICASLMN